MSVSPISASTTTTTEIASNTAAKTTIQPAIKSTDVESQPANTVLMVAPCCFGFNEEAAETNLMQQKIPGASPSELQARAAKEFDDFVQLLRDNDIQVIVVKDLPEPQTPDSIFPNNWFSTHGQNTVHLYPMCCSNRRPERSKDVLKILRETYGDLSIIDWSDREASGQFLEGTGSMVLARSHRVAFAALSPRTDEQLLDEWAKTTGYGVVKFVARDSSHTPIYHTNVMMAMGHDFCIVAGDMIDEKDRERVLEEMKRIGRCPVSITSNQVEQFAGNALELRTTNDEPALVMSKAGWDSLTPEQKSDLELHAHRIITPEIPTIETIGGGSARCMLAEIYLHS
eukprot:Protomagalhaensia_wolfi_Nauph_80__1482@NODE_189_length_3241_cov_56_850094_g142_i0_p2_GENE_NODE_189_length_3241_cov_56_850094_g142_i0NODE_189_length_3241_cov_56_850094_g142_i0_p2_ORF_typecomplete_len342_score77_48Amidinotransf/PF02274_17/2_5e34DctP/PF03480_13/1_6e03DctP/PF03480_13/0_064Alpha_GJ/PF03229_13/10_NODE_189_length_3241_cov_56_850094_g142_i020173042